ncbi:MAG: M36 family metallopeptidase [Saprospiraceae bacterium]|nr:M36 family metallopeptidase [Saprospiraceae bacterium]
MKKFLLLLTGVLLTGFLIAQNQPRLKLAMDHLERNYTSLGLIETDYKDMVISFESTDQRGISYLYFNQTVGGVPIKNAILNYTIAPTGKVAFVGNSFVANKISKLSNDRASLPVERAFAAAADHLGYMGTKAPVVTNRDGDKLIFAPSALCDNLVTAEMKYDMQGDKLVPVWELSMDMKDNADYWEIRINAADASFVAKNNLTVYCQHHHGKYTKHEKCEAAAASQMSHKGVDAQAALSGSASYRVYALPTESPNHGPHVLVTDPHFPEVSPFGWHDINGVEGPEFTTTRGNNTETYSDKNDDDDVDADEPQPEGGSMLNFDFAHDTSKEPLESPLAAQTNLFYMVNMMHDISALYGFDEEWGNFQSKNYTNKGEGNDYVLAQAFDGFGLAAPKLDNANFSTPADGANGRMQMFLWNSPGGGAIKIESPAEIQGYINEYGTADFGNPVPLSTEPALTGSVVIARDGDLSNPTACCKTITTDLTGKIALVDRGLCNFSQKAKLAEDRGAIAVLICNIPGVNGGTGEEISNMTAGTITPNSITSVFLKKSDCDKIRLQLNNGVDVLMTIQEASSTGPRYKDGALDNGIIAHEYGHGISTRLTGGPANSGCLNTAEQMGEGWSDFFSLIMTVEPGDKGSDVRGTGTYAIGETVSGGGIRRFPYSTDMSINPQTFDDIKNTENSASPCNGCHARGEIWTDCLWDLYWAMVDRYGYDANWRNFESGNAKTLLLVMQGMKMQGCSPGFIRGRNAILSADSVLYGGANGFLIWDVFARRGLGFYAEGGSTNDFNDGVENFDPNPYEIALLKIKKDNLPLVKPGEEITVRLETVSHVPATQTGVTIIDNMPPDFTYVANSANVPATVRRIPPLINF